MKNALLGALLLASTVPALAGPPYLTDDPVPTDTRHWEIYAFSAGEVRSSALDGEAGVDLNYGPVEGVQLTATLPIGFSSEPLGGWRSGTGDVELGLKYRFLDEVKHGFSAAIFPRAILPTSSLDKQAGTRLLLPLWLGKEFADGTSIFGGAGYEINPGAGNRNFWQAAVAATTDVSTAFSLGAEIVRQGPDRASGTPQTRAGLGTIIKLSDHNALLFSGGPTWADHRTGYHFYGAFGVFL